MLNDRKRMNVLHKKTNFFHPFLIKIVYSVKFHTKTDKILHVLICLQAIRFYMLYAASPLNRLIETVSV